MLKVVNTQEKGFFPQGWVMRKGSMTVSAVNSNPNIIPLCGIVSTSQQAGSAWAYIYYNNKVVTNYHQFEGTATSRIWFGDEAWSCIKGQLQAQGCTISSVVYWIENVLAGGVVKLTRIIKSAFGGVLYA